MAAKFGISSIYVTLKLGSLITGQRTSADATTAADVPPIWYRSGLTRFPAADACVVPAPAVPVPTIPRVENRAPETPVQSPGSAMSLPATWNGATRSTVFSMATRAATARKGIVFRYAYWRMVRVEEEVG